jgi:hypothetical protein
VLKRQPVSPPAAVATRGITARAFVLTVLTRRTVIKQGGYAALAVAGAPLFVREARARPTPTTFDYYIGPSGSDSNPGTQSQPWAITAINTKQSVYAGKSVGLLDGIYNVHALCQVGNYSIPALRVNGGTSSSPTIVAAVNPRQAILTGANTSGGGFPTTQSAIIGQGHTGQSNIGNVILDGLYITNALQLGITFYPNSGQAQGGATGTVVRNCEICNIAGNENGNVAGILFYYNTGALVQNCRIHGVTPTSGKVGEWDCAGIFSQLCLGNTYEYNTVYDCNCGIYDKNAPNGGHTYRYNYIEIIATYPNYGLVDCAGGLAGQTTTVSNNNFVAPTIAWGSDASHFPALQSWVFYNNTCWYPNGGFTRGGVFLPSAGSGANVTFYNNIIACSGAIQSNGSACFCGGSVVKSDYNCYQGALSNGTIIGISPTSSPYAFRNYTLAGWQSLSGFDTHSVQVATGTLLGSWQSLNPASFQAMPAKVQTLGRVAGVSTGAVTTAGAWGNGATQIGCNFGPVRNSAVLQSRLSR